MRGEVRAGRRGVVQERWVRPEVEGTEPAWSAPGTSCTWL